MSGQLVKQSLMKCMTLYVVFLVVSVSFPGIAFAEQKSSEDTSVYVTFEHVEQGEDAVVLSGSVEEVRDTTQPASDAKSLLPATGDLVNGEVLIAVFMVSAAVMHCAHQKADTFKANG